MVGDIKVAAVVADNWQLLLPADRTHTPELLCRCIELHETNEEMQQLPITDINPLTSMNSDGLENNGASPLKNYSSHKCKYLGLLSHLRQVMIEEMVRPEEILLVENDEGEIVHEFKRVIRSSYTTSREYLDYLTHLDLVDAENVMPEMPQMDMSEASSTTSRNRTPVLPMVAHLKLSSPM